MSKTFRLDADKFEEVKERRHINKRRAFMKEIIIEEAKWKKEKVRKLDECDEELDERDCP